MIWIYSILLQEPFKMKELKRQNIIPETLEKTTIGQANHVCLQVIPAPYPNAYRKDSRGCLTTVWVICKELQRMIELPSLPFFAPSGQVWIRLNQTFSSVRCHCKISVGPQPRWRSDNKTCFRYQHELIASIYISSENTAWGKDFFLITVIEKIP